MSDKDHRRVLVELSKDRRLAHAIFFKHRHPLATPDFHAEMIDDFHGYQEKVVEEAFRGGGKSTIGEEATCLGAEFLDFANGVIVSSTQARAAERLEAIKHEIENNDQLVEVFGEQVGDVWQAHKIVLQNGVCIQALGVGQAVRGIKHHEHRPDFLWIDDIEDEESVKTPEACHDRLKWLYGTLLPVCAKRARIRVTGNRLSPDAVVSKLSADRSWTSRRYPISHRSLDTGREVATWPELRDMTWIEDTRSEYYRLGLDQTWASEYMCEAISETVKPFKVEDYRVVPRTRIWEPVYVMYDPAKTTQAKRGQAQYGKAVWSWMGNKLIFWETFGKTLLPSQLIDDIFATEEKYQPVQIKVEEDGLEEWLREPLRIEQTRRRILLPHLGGERAPKDKDAFIRSLQPFFSSHVIEFASEQAEARGQMLSFPSGLKDILNAMAYALKMRPGNPVYDSFAQDHIVENLDLNLRAPPYLCLNADGTSVTGVLVQYDGTLAVLGDWVMGGEAAQCVEQICKQASLLAAKDINIVVHPKEADLYDNKGLVAALRRIPRKFQVGTLPDKGRAEIRDLLGKRSQVPLVRVSSDATWTLRAFSGGYHKLFNKKGVIDGEAEVGVYRTLMEGVESFAGIMHHDDQDEMVGLFRTSRDGMRYRSLIGDRRAER